MVQRIKNFLFVNTSTHQTIAKNTFWLFSSTFISRLIRAGIIIYAARILGAQGWGAFSYALSIAGFFTIFMDFGINALITRESTRELDAQRKYFATAFVIKLCMGIIISAIIGIMMLVGMDRFIKNGEDVGLITILMPLVILITAFDGLRDFGASLSRAWEKMENESFVQIITNVLLVIASFIALKISPTPVSLAVGYVIGIGVGMIGAFIPFRDYFRDIREQFSFKLIKPILVSCWPYGMIGLMGSIMLNTDSIMIGWFCDIAHVGFYSAGQRIVMFFYAIPVLLSITFFPSMAKLAQKDKKEFAILLRQSLVLMALVAIPLTIGSVVLSKQLIILLYGEAFLPGFPAFLIMNLTYIPVFLSTILANAVFAFNEERKLFPYVILGIGGNLLFNIIFIPTLGITGSALSTLINQSIITCYLYLKIQKNVEINVLSYIYKITLGALIMGGVALIMRFYHIHPYIIAATGTIVYILALLGLKERMAIELYRRIKSFIRPTTSSIDTV